MGAEIRSEAFAGGVADGWQAFALAKSSHARIPWMAAALKDYLRNCWQVAHGAALGPMRPVTQNLAQASKADVAAPVMPGFAATLTDQDVAALVHALRARWGGKPDWTDVTDAIADARRLQTPLQQTASTKENRP